MNADADMMSFYIPYISRTWTEGAVSDVFNQNHVGIVERVDFVDYGRWPDAISCFVHLATWHDNAYAQSIYNEIINGSGSFRLYIPAFPGKYFILRKMTGEKLPSTHMNIHQLAAKIAEMEQYIITHILGQQEEEDDYEMEVVDDADDYEMEVVDDADDYEIEVIEDEDDEMSVEEDAVGCDLTMDQLAHQTAVFDQETKQPLISEIQELMSDFAPMSI
jgi:hypothetical protein